MLSEFVPETFIDGWSDLESIKQIEYKRFGETHLYVSLISFGAAHISRGIKIDQDDDRQKIQEINTTIYEAIRSGINYIDTSPYYGMGKSEILVGQALKNIPRKAFYVSTKVGRHTDCTFDYGHMAVKKSIENSLNNLNVTYIDIVYIHDVEFCLQQQQLFDETLPALEQLRQEKKIRYIGISGYPLTILKEIVEKSSIKINVILSYCRHTLWDQELCNYLDYFKSKNVGIINAAIFGMGLIGDGHLNLSEWHPASQIIRDQCEKARKICMERGISINRIALKHSLSEKRIDTHLIGMESLEMVKNNLSMIKLNSLSSALDEKEKESLDFLLNKIFNHGSSNGNNNWEQIELNRYRQNPTEFIKFLRQSWT